MHPGIVEIASIANRLQPLLKAGDVLPNVKISLRGESTSFTDFFRAQTGVIFGGQGAFWPVPTTRQLPGFKQYSQLLKTKVSFVGCISVNDPFVLRAWARSKGITDEVTFVSDGDGRLVDRMGLRPLLNDQQSRNLKCRMFAMIIEPGAIVKWITVDKDCFAEDVCQFLGLEIPSTTAIGIDASPQVTPQMQFTGALKSIQPGCNGNVAASTPPFLPKSQKKAMERLSQCVSSPVYQNLAKSKHGSEEDEQSVDGMTPYSGTSSSTLVEEHDFNETSQFYAENFKELSRKSTTRNLLLALSEGGGSSTEKFIRDDVDTKSIESKASRRDLAFARSQSSGFRQSLIYSLHDEEQSDGSNSNYLPSLHDEKHPETLVSTRENLDTRAFWQSTVLATSSRIEPLKRLPHIILRVAEEPGPDNVLIDYSQKPPLYNVIHADFCLQVEVPAGARSLGKVDLQGKTYKASQFHFIAPSPHNLDHGNYRRPLELRIVHQNVENSHQPLILAVTFEATPTGKKSEFLDTCLSIPTLDPGVCEIFSCGFRSLRGGGFDLNSLFHPGMQLILYKSIVGLYSHQITWLVAPNAIQASQEQIEQLRQYLRGRTEHEVFDRPEDLYAFAFAKEIPPKLDLINIKQRSTAVLNFKTRLDYIRRLSHVGLVSFITYFNNKDVETRAPEQEFAGVMVLLSVFLKRLVRMLLCLIETIDQLQGFFTDPKQYLQNLRDATCQGSEDVAPRLIRSRFGNLLDLSDISWHIGEIPTHDRLAKEAEASMSLSPRTSANEKLVEQLEPPPEPELTPTKAITPTSSPPNLPTSTSDPKVTLPAVLSPGSTSSLKRRHSNPALPTVSFPRSDGKFAFVRGGAMLPASGSEGPSSPMASPPSMEQERSNDRHQSLNAMTVTGGTQLDRTLRNPRRATTAHPSGLSDDHVALATFMIKQLARCASAESLDDATVANTQANMKSSNHFSVLSQGLNPTPSKRNGRGIAFQFPSSSANTSANERPTRVMFKQESSVGSTVEYHQRTADEWEEASRHDVRVGRIRTRAPTGHPRAMMAGRRGLVEDAYDDHDAIPIRRPSRRNVDSDQQGVLRNSSSDSYVPRPTWTNPKRGLTFCMANRLSESSDTFEPSMERRGWHDEDSSEEIDRRLNRIKNMRVRGSRRPQFEEHMADDDSDGYWESRRAERGKRIGGRKGTGHPNITKLIRQSDSLSDEEVIRKGKIIFQEPTKLPPTNYRDFDWQSESPQRRGHGTDRGDDRYRRARAGDERRGNERASRVDFDESFDRLNGEWEARREERSNRVRARKGTGHPKISKEGEIPEKPENRKKTKVGFGTVESHGGDDVDWDSRREMRGIRVRNRKATGHPKVAKDFLKGAHKRLERYRINSSESDEIVENPKIAKVKFGHQNFDTDGDPRWPSRHDDRVARIRSRKSTGFRQAGSGDEEGAGELKLPTRNVDRKSFEFDSPRQSQIQSPRKVGFGCAANVTSPKEFISQRVDDCRRLDDLTSVTTTPDSSWQESRPTSHQAVVTFGPIHRDECNLDWNKAERAVERSGRIRGRAQTGFASSMCPQSSSDDSKTHSSPHKKDDAINERLIPKSTALLSPETFGSRTRRISFDSGTLTTPDPPPPVPTIDDKTPKEFSRMRGRRASMKQEVPNVSQDVAHLRVQLGIM